MTTGLLAAATARVRPGPLLSVRDLVVRFGPFLALDHVDLEIEPGEIVALAGENGAGKSTLVRSIAGDVVPSGGEILLSGRPVAGDPAAAARHGAAFVWQDLALCDNLDVASNLLLGRERGISLLSDARFHADAALLLERAGLPLRDTMRSVGTLSGGQRQLVAVARALRDGPRLLVLDEPTAALGVVESVEVERLVLRLREQGAAVVLVSHDVEQLFRLADRIVVLRNGAVVADVDPAIAHPDDIVALMSGQEIDSSARGQLTRLHRLADQLAAADRSSSLSLICSTLGAALSAGRLCIHLVDREGVDREGVDANGGGGAGGGSLVCAASVGLPPELLAAWSRLPFGPDGGPPGAVAQRREPVVVEDARAEPSWSPFRETAVESRVASSWSIPITGADGLIGVFTVLRSTLGRPRRDELDLGTLYASYAAGAIERDQLFGEVTIRNRVLETIREVLETLAGPVAVGEGLDLAARALCDGLQAVEVALVAQPAAREVQVRAVAATAAPGSVAATAAPGSAAATGMLDRTRPTQAQPTQALSAGMACVADEALAARPTRSAPMTRSIDGAQYVAVSFGAPGGHAVLVARWEGRGVPPEAAALLGDAAHSFRLALEREEAGQVHQEAAALRRSHELQRGFLSRLSHELRTPLTAIRGYASSLMQPDVTWDGDSEQRFLSRIAAESARLSDLVGDLLDFSAIESGVMRLQLDWCDIGLVLDAAAACLPPSECERVSIDCSPDLPVVWADHDRLEQVLVNLMDNALRHNPPSTRVTVRVRLEGEGSAVLAVGDDGPGMSAELAESPFDPGRRRWTPTAGTGLGLSIAKGIVDAHGGTIEIATGEHGTSVSVHLPVEGVDRRPEEGPAGVLDTPPLIGAPDGTAPR